MVPVSRYPSAPSPPPGTYPECDAPANTPVADPFSDEGSIPARSSASQEVSSSTRCCGSIASASRGLIPKNPASKSAAPGMNPPTRVYPSSPASQPRSAGNPEIASVPVDRSSHRPSGSRTPPGNRQPIPTIASGSPSTTATRGAGTAGTAASSPPSSSPRTSAATAAGVG